MELHAGDAFAGRHIVIHGIRRPGCHSPDDGESILLASGDRNGSGATAQAFLWNPAARHRDRRNRPQNEAELPGFSGKPSEALLTWTRVHRLLYLESHDVG